MDPGIIGQLPKKQAVVYPGRIGTIEECQVPRVNL